MACGCGCSGMAGCDCTRPVAVGPFRITRGDRTWIALPRRTYDPSLSGEPAYCKYPLIARAPGFRVSGPPPPGACGASYPELLIAAGGRTIDSPFDKPWCGQTDSEAWKAQADAVAQLVRAAWNALMERANAAGDYTETRALDGSVGAYEEEHANLPEPSVFHAFGAGGCGEDVATMQANIRSGTCQLERLNAAIGRMGGSPIDVPYQPEPAPSPVPWAVGAGVGLALLALVAVFALRR